MDKAPSRLDEFGDSEKTDDSAMITVTLKDSSQYTFQRDGKDVSVLLLEDELVVEFSTKKGPKSVQKVSVTDILVVVISPNVKDKQTSMVTVHFIEITKNHIWQVSTFTFCGQHDICKEFKDDIQEAIATITQRPKNLLVIINPFSGRKKGAEIYKRRVAPIFSLCNIKTEVVVTEKKGQAKSLVQTYNLNEIDGVVCVGGDGTYYEIINGLFLQYQQMSRLELDNPDEQWGSVTTPVGLIAAVTGFDVQISFVKPAKGTGNGIATGCFNTLDPATAALHIIKGNSKPNVSYTVHVNGKFLTYGALLNGYGFYGDIIYASEHSRWLGIARYPIMMMKSLWSVRTFEAEIEYLKAEDDQEEMSKADFEAAGAKSTGNPDAQYFTMTMGKLVKLIQKEDPMPYAASSNINLSDTSWLRVPGGPYTSIGAMCHDCSSKTIRVNLGLITSASGFQITRHLVSLMRQQANAYNFDFVQLFKVRGYRVKIRHQDGAEHQWTDLELNLNCDGEPIRLSRPEFEVHFHGGLIRCFSSLPDKDNVKL